MKHTKTLEKLFQKNISCFDDKKFIIERTTRVKLTNFLQNYKHILDVDIKNELIIYSKLF